VFDHPFNSVRYDWLSETGATVEESGMSDFDGCGCWLDYPIPPEIGKGRYESLVLSAGVSLVRSILEFSPAVMGKGVALMEVDVEFKEPSFQVMTLRGLRGSAQEHYPPACLTIVPGIDMFRHTEHYRTVFTADGTFGGESYHVSVGRTAMGHLIGDEPAAVLLDKLGITHAPGIAVHAVPLRTSHALIAASSPMLTGLARKVFCQAKVLEYLAALLDYMSAGTREGTSNDQRATQRVHAIHDQLVASEGRLPSMEELALQYGRSAKQLNDEFSRVFGQSIYAFITGHRLKEAHAALVETNIPIKQLAARLGYAHTSNFSIAFKRQFGYPPGSLRKSH
jgi:AraC-like DNA-binding protein